MNKENISKVYLLSTPLDSNYKNTLYFTSKESQQTYFQSVIKKSYTGFTYLRKDNLIYVPDHIDNIYDANYVMYQNTYYDNKWFYAFIKDMKYESDECTIIEIETDVIQTWLFDYIVLPSFIEREHIANDKEGDNTVPEGLETGEFIVNSLSSDDTMEDLAIYVAFSEYTNDDIKVVGNFYGGIYSGMAYHMFPNTTSGILDLNDFINAYDKGKTDAIMSLFMAPAYLGLEGTNTSSFDHQQVKPSGSAKYYWIEKDKQTTLNGYTPRNKKLLTFPYNYLCVSNNNGTDVIYHYEKFSGNTGDKCRFQVGGCLTPGGSIRMVPYGYNGVSPNNDEGINGGKFPICCWNSDTYTNWLTQNGVNIGLNLLSGAGQVVAGAGIAIASGGLGMAVGGSSIVSGVSSIASTLAQVHQQSFVPNQVRGNTNCGDIITASGDNSFQFYNMSIKKEWAERLDSYFDMFGYKVNRVDVPKTNHMKRYWYTKTIDANISGNIPKMDIEKIKNCYDNGITFWKNASTICIYPTSNPDGTINNSNR